MLPQCPIVLCLNCNAAILPFSALSLLQFCPDFTNSKLQMVLLASKQPSPINAVHNDITTYLQWSTTSPLAQVDTYFYNIPGTPLTFGNPLIPMLNVGKLSKSRHVLVLSVTSHCNLASEALQTTQRHVPQHQHTPLPIPDPPNPLTRAIHSTSLDFQHLSCVLEPLDVPKQHLHCCVPQLLHPLSPGPCAGAA
eukprot:scaffold3266_cov21-Tisochrysis_lutea.AAC.1